MNWNTRSTKAVRMACKDCGISTNKLNRKQMIAILSMKFGDFRKLFEVPRQRNGKYSGEYLKLILKVRDNEQDRGYQKAA